MPRSKAANLELNVMFDYSGLNGLVEEIKQASRSIELGDSRMASRLDSIEQSVNDLYRKTSRPGGEWHGGDEAAFERKSAIEMCRIRHTDRVPKDDGIPTKEYLPSSGEIDEALAARRGFKQYLRHGDLAKLDNLERKSLSAFSFGNNGFLLAPERSNRVMSCLVDPSDLSGLVDRVQISGPSVRFLLNNVRMGLGHSACESSCWSGAGQNPEGLGEIEIKPETIRVVVCATRDLVEDASFNLENWLFEKISIGMRATINEALLLGDGAGKPLGMLNQRSGIPICDTSASTPPSGFSWQDLVMLKFELPMQWHAGASYVLNQRTFALLLTMSDGMGRPLLQALPQEQPSFLLAGSPIVIASQMPDVGPGATPVMFGNFKKTYMIVERKAVTLQVDPFSAGWCTLYKAEARTGGAATCPNAARLLRVR